MKIFLVILAVLLCILFSILFVRINVIFEAQYKEKDFKLKLRAYVINRFFGKSFDFSKKEKDEDLQEAKETKSQQPLEEGKEDEEKKTIREFLNSLKRRLKKYLNYKDAFELSRNRIRKKFVFKTLNLSVNYGDGDAHTTAVATGAMWGLIYNILGFITSTATVKKHSENVNALFGKKDFSALAEGIFTTRLVHIIYAVILFRRNYKKILKIQNKSNEK